jgi:hypothetical protein
MPISPTARRSVIERAGHRCEYCQIYGWPLTIDHIIPISAWGATQRAPTIPRTDPDDLDNLASACAPCNRAKSGTMTVRDPVTGVEVQLFNPRQNHWDMHFAWQADYRMAVGLTPIGRATVAQLRLNRELYQRQRTLLRAALQSGGPPWP